MTRRTIPAALIVAAALMAVSAVPASAKDLVGTFTFTAGKSKVTKKCGKRFVKVTGTYFQMLQPGKPKYRRDACRKRVLSPKSFFANPNSRSKDKTYTLMRPGKDGGLVTGAYQPMPDPPFDIAADGSSLANRIMQTERFAGIKFGLSTDPVDQQTQEPVNPPRVTQNGRKLGGDLRAFTASWQNQFFNQGSPKPRGNRPGGTRRVTGTYNARTKRYTLIWRSQIVGGAFHGFVGYWHLQGKFKPAS